MTADADRYDVVVVGGGTAGLVAARDLAAAGRSVRLVEARDRFGGRAWSGPFGGDGPTVEYGGGWFDAGLQRPLAEELERYGVPYADATSYATTRWFTDGVARSGFPVPIADGGDLERAIVALNAAAAGLTSGAQEDRGLSIAEWTERLAPRPATRDFLYGWFGLMTGAQPEEVGADGIIGLVAETGSAYAFYSDLAHVFAGGTNTLTAALAADLGGPADLERPVTEIVQDDDDGVVVRTADGAELRCAVCVLAVPINVVSSIRFTPELPAARRDPLVVGHPCRVTKVWIAATGVPERMLGAGWDTPLHWLAAQRPADLPDAPDAQLVVGFAMDGALDVSDHDAVERALRAYAPEARVLAVDGHDWNADPWSRGAWGVAPVSWDTATLDAIASPHGRVLMAGSDVSTEFGGWIAGAVTSGRATAAQALALLG